MNKMDLELFNKYALKYGYEHATPRVKFFEWSKLPKDIKHLIIEYIDDKEIENVNIEIFNLYHRRFNGIKLLELAKEYIGFGGQPLKVYNIINLITPNQIDLFDTNNNIYYWSFKWYICKGFFPEEYHRYRSIIETNVYYPQGIKVDYLKYIMDHVDITVHKPYIILKFINNYNTCEWIDILGFNHQDVVNILTGNRKSANHLLLNIYHRYGYKIGNEKCIEWCSYLDDDYLKVLDIMETKATPEELNRILCLVTPYHLDELCQIEPFKSNLDISILKIKICAMSLEYIPFDFETFNNFCKTHENFNKFWESLMRLSNKEQFLTIQAKFMFKINLALHVMKTRWPNEYNQMAPKYILKHLTCRMCECSRIDSLENLLELDYGLYNEKIALMIKCSTRYTQIQNPNLGYYLVLYNNEYMNDIEIVKLILKRKDPKYLDRLFNHYKDKQNILEDIIQSSINI